MTQYESEMAGLERDFSEERISPQDYDKQVRDMERSYREELQGLAEEAAEQAYRDVIGY